MTGGFDMNQFGAASEGKLSEMKNVAEAFLGGHGSPYVAQVSMADAPKLYKAMLDGLEYRGTSFFHCFTTCQPEHGVADDMATPQAVRVRNCRGLPEFTFNPALGETYQEAISLKGNRNVDRDWMIGKYKETGEKYNYTVAHWCASEGRFRKHLKRVKDADIAEMIHLDDILCRVMQDDVVNRRYMDPDHRAFVPQFGTYIHFEDNARKLSYVALSRQMVLFVIERRKAWRLLQSKAGITNKDYEAQKVLLEKVDSEEIPMKELFRRGRDMLDLVVAGKDPMEPPAEEGESAPEKEELSPA
jgi:pyruvate-ferredoxin/flavodoxin oxidoreductase